MKSKIFWLVTMFCLFSIVPALAAGVSKQELALQAVSPDASARAEAVKSLRSMGRDGLEALFEEFSPQIKRYKETGEADDEWKRIAAALDTVAQQKDAYASRLFWHTDLEDALKAAKAKNRPVLSLRLLGNLNEEFSCANSRFFRALLYSNAEISKYLREHYVLHWRSVRPAPKVTIDFGDGRRIERTLTGNSIHYVLDENGEIIDALPGLYSPSGFLKYLVAGRETNKVIDGLAKTPKTMALLRYRRAAFDQIYDKRQKAIEIAKVKLVEPIIETGPLGELRVSAITAAPFAATKMAVTDEISILRGISDDFSRFEPGVNLSDWRKLAALYAGATRFDEASIAFIKRQNARTGLTEAEFTGLLKNLESYVALDTTRNDFLFHMKLYEWLNRSREEKTDLEQFNARVYAEIFRTPDSDKWLGLYNTDVYTALDGNGVVQ